MRGSSEDPEERLRLALCDKLSWLRHQALPLWAERGVDSKGGFFEQIGQSGRPVKDLPRRARVVARQTYVFATATAQGWGEYSELIEHGFSELLNRCILDDGLSLSTYSADGTPLKRDFDAYDQAFVLFALATVASVCEHRRVEATVAGERLLGVMRERYRHPGIGFEEAIPRKTPLLQNPHMHLLEACLAFDGVSDVAPVWREQAGELVELAKTRLADSTTGAIHEYFDGDWRPIIDEEGGWIEPGHQFEWAWLLWAWCDRNKDLQVEKLASSLYAIGSTFGRAASGQVIDATDGRLARRAATSRLWPQTERLKASIAAAERTVGGDMIAEQNDALEAVTCLDPYLATPIVGLWFDRLDVSGAPIQAAAPASSLYHIVCAFEYADRVLSRRQPTGN